MLPKLNLSEGEGLADYDGLLTCHIVIAHTVGECYCHCIMPIAVHWITSLLLLLLLLLICIFPGSHNGLFKWVLSDTDDCVRAEGLFALAALAIRVRCAAS